MLAEIHQADPLPVNRESFAVDLARRGFAHSAEVYQEARRRTPTFKLSEADLKGCHHRG
jgi:hypothetical protein